MEYDENERSEIEGYLRNNLSQLNVTDNAILVAGIIVSEWIMPNGRRFLARTPIGELSSWQTQGYLFSTLYEQDWEHLDDDNTLNGEDDDDEE